MKLIVTINIPEEVVERERGELTREEFKKEALREFSADHEDMPQGVTLSTEVED